jgi:hypothetical protein
LFLVSTSLRHSSLPSAIRMPIYKMVMEKARWEGISPVAFMSVLTLEGKCLCWRARPAHLAGHLPDSLAVCQRLRNFAPE